MTKRHAMLLKYDDDIIFYFDIFPRQQGITIFGQITHLVKQMSHLVEKNNNVVSEQVQHKPGCTSTEAG